MEKRRKRRRALVAAAEYFDLPAQVAAGEARLTVTGRRLLVENHRGIYEYTAERISVDCGDFLAQISGDRLTLGAMNTNELMIEGDIRTVEFIDRSKGRKS